MMAGSPVAAGDFPELRHLGGAALVGVGAAGAETAAARRVQGAGHVTLQHDTVACAGGLGVRHRDGRDQAAGVGVDAVSDQLKAVGQLHQLAQVHNADAVGNDNIETEIAPIVGSEQQAKDLVNYINEAAKSPDGVWGTNIFGKSIEELVMDGVRNKIAMIGDESQAKLQDTMQKIVNDSNGGMVCIII